MTPGFNMDGLRRLLIVTVLKLKTGIIFKTKDSSLCPSPMCRISILSFRTHIYTGPAELCLGEIYSQVTPTMHVTKDFIACGPKTILNGTSIGQRLIGLIWINTLASPVSAATTTTPLQWWGTVTKGSEWQAHGNSITATSPWIKPSDYLKVHCRNKQNLDPSGSKILYIVGRSPFEALASDLI